MTTRVVIALLVIAGAAGCSDGAARNAAQVKAAAEQAAEAQARADAAAAREAERLKAMWIYSDTPAGRGRELSAQVRSTNDVDTDGTGGRRVLLVFRDHPAWRRSSYLVLTAGDFRCTPRCTVSVAFDSQPSQSMAAHRPNTDEAIAMFIDDWRALWRTLAGVKQVTIEFPVKAGGTRRATFDVAGLDRTKLPDWDRLSAVAGR